MLTTRKQKEINSNFYFISGWRKEKDEKHFMHEEMQTAITLKNA